MFQCTQKNVYPIVADMLYLCQLCWLDYFSKSFIALVILEENLFLLLVTKASLLKSLNMIMSLCFFSFITSDYFILIWLLYSSGNPFFLRLYFLYVYIKHSKVHKSQMYSLVHIYVYVKTLFKSVIKYSITPKHYVPYQLATILNSLPYTCILIAVWHLLHIHFKFFHDIVYIYLFLSFQLYTTVNLSIFYWFIFRLTQVAFFGVALLWIKPLWTFLYRSSLHTHMYIPLWHVPRSKIIGS
jgi:hypothetical protein